MPLFQDERVYPYRKASKYPGMSPKDIAVWEQFIEHNPEFTNEVYYNFRVGEGMTLAIEYESNIAKMAKAITQLRIDVLSVHKDFIRVIELKPLASCTAIGQLLAYTTLIERQYANIPQIAPTLAPDEYINLSLNPPNAIFFTLNVHKKLIKKAVITIGIYKYLTKNIV